jgi:hypothetical protein
MFGPTIAFGLLPYEAPDLIIDNIFLGGIQSAINCDRLKELDIKSILVIGRELPKLFPDHFDYK